MTYDRGPWQFDQPHPDLLEDVASPHEQAIEVVHHATAIYTTMSVVESVLDRLDWPACGGRLLDPSAGDGAFLIAAITRLAPNPGDIETLHRVRGYEFHPGAVADARHRVANALEQLGWDREDATVAAYEVVEQRDFLTEGGHETYATVVANPPYLKYARIPDYFKKLYATVVKRYALGDLLHAFLDKTMQVLEPNGSVGLISSDRWMFNQTASQLRVELGKLVGIEHVERLDVTTSFYRPKVRRAGSPPRIHPITVIMRRGADNLVPLTAAPISPDGYSEEAWDGPTMGDVATIRLAPWLGPHGVFTIDAEMADSLGPEAVLVPVVDTDDVDPQSNALSSPSRLAIMTQRDLEPQGPLAAHLIANRYRMPPRGRRGNYWVPPEALRPSSGAPSIMVPRIAQRIRVIDLPPGVMAINHNLTLFQGHADGPSLEQLKAALLSERSHAWLLRNAPRLESGYLSITTTLLRRMPFRVD